MTYDADVRIDCQAVLRANQTSFVSITTRAIPVVDTVNFTLSIWGLAGAVHSKQVREAHSCEFCVGVQKSYKGERNHRGFCQDL